MSEQNAIQNRRTILDALLMFSNIGLPFDVVSTGRNWRDEGLGRPLYRPPSWGLKLYEADHACPGFAAAVEKLWSIYDRILCFGSLDNAEVKEFKQQINAVKALLTEHQRTASTRL